MVKLQRSQLAVLRYEQLEAAEVVATIDQQEIRVDLVEVVLLEAILVLQLRITFLDIRVTVSHQQNTQVQDRVEQVHLRPVLQVPAVLV
jgi:hypothetical protein